MENQSVTPNEQAVTANQSVEPNQGNGQGYNQNNNPNYNQNYNQNNGEFVERRSWVMALVLAFFLGSFGAHRFYMGYNTSGIVMLILTLISPFTLFITLLIAGLWAFIDLIRILVGSLKCADGSDLKK